MSFRHTSDPDRAEAVVAILVAACVLGAIVLSAACWRLWQ